MQPLHSGASGKASVSVWVEVEVGEMQCLPVVHPGKLHPKPSRIRATGNSPRGRPMGERGHARARVNPAYLPASAPAQGSKCGRLLSVWVRTSERCPFQVWATRTVLGREPAVRLAETCLTCILRCSGRCQCRLESGRYSLPFHRRMRTMVAG